MSWTEERVELLKKLWADGLTASQIAKALGGVTRNAVIGKVHRLGLSGRSTPTRTSRPRPHRQRAPSHPGRPSYASAGNTALKSDPHQAAEASPDPIPATIHELEIPPGERANILSLNENTCRWPIGEPGTDEFYFCGRNPSAGPYCEHHARIAYQPVQDRRRKRSATR